MLQDLPGLASRPLKVCRKPLSLEKKAHDAVTETECSSCGALYFGDETFCAECGGTLAPPEIARQLGKQERQQASVELRKAVRRVSRLKTWVTYNLIMTALHTVTLGLILLVSDLSAGKAALWLSMQVAILLLAIFSRVFFDRKPFPILVTLASVGTLSNLLYLLGDLPESPLQGGLRSVGPVMTVVFWLLTVEAAQISRLARKHPDLYLAKRLRGEHLTHRETQGKTQKETRGKRLVRVSREQDTRRFSTIVAIAVGIVLLIVLGLGLNEIAHAPPSPEAALSGFRTAWNAEDREALSRTAVGSWREKFLRSLRVIGKRHEWGTHLPPIEEGSWRKSNEEKIVAEFPSENGTIKVHFKYEAEAWRVSGLDLRDVQDWRPGN